MIPAALLAGFIAAHAIWSISDGDGLVPIYGYVDAANKRALDRIVQQPLEAAVETGRSRLIANPHDSLAGVLAYDGYITLPNGKIDAILLEIRDYEHPDSDVLLAVPYRPNKSGSGFVVFRPKLLKYPVTGRAQAEDFIKAFWSGVDSHRQGSQVWNEHLDQSQ